MLEKLGGALGTRGDGDMLIVAHTDAPAAIGFADRSAGAPRGRLDRREAKRCSATTAITSPAAED
jgi:hypothetical protein